MKSLFHLGLIVLLTATLACGEDEASLRPIAPLPIEGHWQVVEVIHDSSPREGSGDGARGGARDTFDDVIEGGTSFVTFDEFAVRATNQRGIGFRRAHLTPYSRSEDTILIDGIAYGYTLTETELLLVAPDGPSADLSFRLERRETAPAFEDWVAPYASVRGIQVTESGGDISHIGGNIWVAGGPDGQELRRVQIESSSWVPVDVQGNAPQAVHAVGDVLYGGGGSDRRVFRIDPDTGDAASMTTNIGRDITGITGTGIFLWVTTAGDSHLHIWDNFFDRLRASVNLGTQLRSQGSEIGGCVIVGESIFIALDGVVTEFHFRPSSEPFTPILEAVGAFALPGKYITGVTHDGTNFWVNARDRGGDAWIVQEVAPQ